MANRIESVWLLALALFATCDRAPSNESPEPAPTSPRPRPVAAKPESPARPQAIPDLDPTSRTVDLLPLLEDGPRLQAVIIAGDAKLWAIARDQGQSLVGRERGGRLEIVGRVDERWPAVRPEGSDSLKIYVAGAWNVLSPDGELKVTPETGGLARRWARDDGEPVAVGEETWTFEENPGRLTIEAADGSITKLRLDANVRVVDGVTAADDRILVHHDGGKPIRTIDRTGHVVAIAKVDERIGRHVSSGVGAQPVIVDGHRVLWVERTDEISRVRAVHIDGGPAVTIDEVDKTQRWELEIGHANDGWVAVLLRSNTSPEEVRLHKIPPLAVDPEPMAAFNDPVGLDRWPVSAAMRKRLAEAEVSSFRDLDNRYYYELKPWIESLAPAERTELEFAREALQFHAWHDEPIDTTPLSPAVLKPVTSLGLSAKTVAKLDKAGLQTVAQLLARPEVHIRKINGMTPDEAQAVLDAVKREGFELGMRWEEIRDLSSK